MIQCKMRNRIGNNAACQRLRDVGKLEMRNGVRDVSTFQRLVKASTKSEMCDRVGDKTKFLNLVEVMNKFQMRDGVGDNATLQWHI